MQKKQALEIGSFSAELSGLILPVGLRVKNVKLSGSGLRCTAHPPSAVSDEPGDLEVFVAQEDLAKFLNESSPAGLKNVQVEAREGRLHITATKTVLIDLKAQAACTLRIVEGRKLFVELESVDILGAGPKQLVQSFLDKVNPVLDTADFPVDATLESVLVGGGGVLLRGKVISGGAR